MTKISNPQSIAIEFHTEGATLTLEHQGKVHVSKDSAGVYRAVTEWSGTEYGNGFLTVLYAVEYILGVEVDEQSTEPRFLPTEESDIFTVVGEGYSDGEHLAVRMVRDAFPEAQITLR